jgi:hypothetical protein
MQMVWGFTKRLSHQLKLMSMDFRNLITLLAFQTQPNLGILTLRHPKFDKLICA